MQRAVNYREIDPIQTKNTVVIVNNFVVNTTDFLNKFSYWCEKKLTEVTTNIERLEITLNILEAKLSSIPGLEGSEPIATSTPSSAPSNSESSTMETSDGFAPPPPPPPMPGSSTPRITATAPVEPVTIEQPQVVESNGPKVKDDPLYERFFKMQRMGVPNPQIAMAMRTAGLDPSVLDNPDAPAPSRSRELKDDSDDESEDDEPRGTTISPKLPSSAPSVQPSRASTPPLPPPPPPMSPPTPRSEPQPPAPPTLAPAAPAPPPPPMLSPPIPPPVPGRAITEDSDSSEDDESEEDD